MRGKKKEFFALYPLIVRMNPKSSVKRIVAAFLYYSGIIRGLWSVYDNPSIILAYHRVLPKDSDDISFIQPGMYVTVETFEKQMAFISRRFNTMRLDDITRTSNPKNACIVTFDDGWADNYAYAFPILKKYGIHATMFVSTNIIGSNELPWTDRVAYYTYNSALDNIIQVTECAWKKIGKESSGIQQFIKDKRFFVERVIFDMKKMKNQEILSVMDEFDSKFSYEKECLMKSRPWMTWDEIMEMKDGGISFGSHAHNHLILTSIPLRQVQDEVVMSKRILFERMGARVTMFSYPNGCYNNEIIRVISENGFTKAVTTKKGFINESRSLLSLNRIMIHDDMTNSIPMFASIISNMIPYY